MGRRGIGNVPALMADLNPLPGNPGKSWAARIYATDLGGANLSSPIGDEVDLPPLAFG